MGGAIADAPLQFLVKLLHRLLGSLALQFSRRASRKHLQDLLRALRIRERLTRKNTERSNGSALAILQSNSHVAFYLHVGQDGKASSYIASTMVGPLVKRDRAGRPRDINGSVGCRLAIGPSRQKVKAIAINDFGDKSVGGLQRSGNMTYQRSKKVWAS